MLTPSSHDRIAACPASEVLPQIKEEASEDASRGTIIHAFLDDCAKHGRDEALARAPDDFKLVCAAIDIDRLPIGKAFRSEVAFAYDYVKGTARELPVRNRQYVGLAPTEIPGTCDVVAELDADTAYAGDYKTGHRPPKPDSMQMRDYALFAARALGKSQAVTEIVHVREDGTVWRERAEFDAFDLAIHEQQIRDTLDAVAKADPSKVTTGEHCRYCPAFKTCPATLALSRQLAGGGLEIPPLTKETAALALERAKAAKKVIAAVEAEIKAFAEREAIPLQNGKTYGPRPWSTREVVVEHALPVLVEKFGAEAVDRALPRKATVSAVEKLAKEAAIAAGEKAAPAVRALMADLEKVGAIRVEETMQVREH